MRAERGKRLMASKMRDGYPPVSEITYTVISHATEDSGIIRRILMDLIPEDRRDKLGLKDASVKGHYGDKITIYTLSLKGEEAAEAFSHIISMLTQESVRFLEATIPRRLERGRILHLRVDKQELATGRYVLVDSDETVKVRVRFSRRLSQAELEGLIASIRGKNGP